LEFDRKFDAVIGRYVLLFQQSPGDVLRQLVRHVRPDGLVVFHEPDWDGTRSSPPVPSYDRCATWIFDTTRLYGHETHMGVKLHAAFVAAGLPAPTMRIEAVIGAGDDSHAVVDLIAELALTMLPEMERLGVVSAGEVAAETLVERIHRDVIAANSVVVGRSEVGAWSRVPRQP
jgi:2-polyprenyl-3-methyl-5-hydroxy-6-metoxy-1,4-benzoquinol methylase